MASLLSVKLLAFSIIILLSLPHSVQPIPEQELDSMLSALRSKGYNLFGNAITTSDICYEILAGTSFTFFAPTDSSLFALDMVATASDYVSSLRHHVVLHRFSATDLRSLRSASLRTLLPNHDVLISVNRPPDDDSSSFSVVVTVNGIDVVLPGLFYGRNVAVHGLNGILNHRWNQQPQENNSSFLNGPSLAPGIQQVPPIFMPPAYGFPVDVSSPPESSESSPSPLVTENNGYTEVPSLEDLDSDAYLSRMEMELRDKRRRIPALAPHFHWPFDANNKKMRRRYGFAPSQHHV